MIYDIGLGVLQVQLIEYNKNKSICDPLSQREHVSSSYSLITGNSLFHATSLTEYFHEFFLMMKQSRKMISGGL